jgi:NAD(P)-dependent dehydrogenase (short-subunit alcohol dehydrogenase family)
MSLLPNLVETANVLICGASRGIGLALCTALLAREDVRQVWAASRGAGESEALAALASQYGDRLQRVACDARDEASLQALTGRIRASCPHLHLAISTTAILHQDGARAEKSLAQLSLEGLEASFATNAFAPILLLKHLVPLLRTRPATFVALSARVGSIGDNRLGGWYSYRASKAALNQLLRTASIELKRLNPASTVLALHPGTTATELSGPFQANVPQGQLFDPAFAAQCILDQISIHGPAQSGSFWAWDGEPIAW